MPTAAAAAIAETVLAVKAADRTGIAIRGKDRTSWLNGLVTCELAKLTPGQGAYGLIVEKKGRIQTDLFIVPSRADDAFLLGVPRGLASGVLETLDHYLVMEDVDLEPVDVVLWELHGPRAGAVTAALGAPFAGAVEILAAAVVGAPAAEGDPFAARVAAAVAEAGGAVADDVTWEALRIERGLPRFGVEFDATFYPQEAGLEKVAVSFEKGCYLGQEVVYMLEHRGHVKRRLVPLDVDGAGVVERGAAVTTADGTAAGDVKSSVVGPRSGRPVAIAMIKWAQSQPGTELRIGDRIARVRGA